MCKNLTAVSENLQQSGRDLSSKPVGGKGKLGEVVQKNQWGGYKVSQPGTGIRRLPIRAELMTGGGGGGAVEDFSRVD